MVLFSTLPPHTVDDIRRHVEVRSAPFDPNTSDDALMRLVGSGSSPAFTELTRRYEKRVRAFCSCLLEGHAQSNDAAQEVFVKLWLMRARFKAQGRFKELLFTIARNECRARRKRAWLRTVLGLRLQSSEVELESSPETLALESEHDAAIRVALRALPEKFALPLTLRFVEGLDYASIAAVLGRTESAARSRIHYGLKQLAAALPGGL